MALLRRLFGPRRQEIWRQPSSEIHGRYVEWRGEGAAYETDPHLDLR